MHVYRELRVAVPPGQTPASVVAALANGTPARGWNRDEAAEAELPPGSPSLVCFTKADRPAHAAVTVWLSGSSDGAELRVADILDRSGDLTRSAYNDLLVQFADDVVRPALSAGVRVEVTPEHADITQWVPPAVADKLLAFAAAANKQTGSSHPYDAERWMDFLAAAHRNPGRLTPDLLAQWLTEDRGFPPVVADRLAEEYEFGQGLLATYDRKVG